MTHLCVWPVAMYCRQQRRCFSAHGAAIHAPHLDLSTLAAALHFVMRCYIRPRPVCLRSHECTGSQTQLCIDSSTCIQVSVVCISESASMHAPIITLQAYLAWQTMW